MPTEALDGDDLRIYELVVRQFFAALMGPATFDVVEREVEVDIGEASPLVFTTNAKSLEVPGFLEALGQEKDVFANLLKAVGEFDKDAFADLEEEIVALFVSFKKRRSAA